MNRCLACPLFAVAAAVAVWPQPAFCSPWTLARGVALMRAGFDFQLATSEFLDRDGERPFSLDGRFAGTTLDLGIRIGLTDRLELEFGLPIRVVNFNADPVILRTFEGDDVDEALAFYQANIVDFSQTSAGVGDLRLAARYQVALQPLAVAVELAVKAPTGYRGPEGTFGREPTTVEALEANQDEIARPERVRDDVTLGDAQLDLAGRVLVGRAFTTGTFVRASAGYNLRMGGAGDQVLGDLRIGQAISDRFLIFGFGRIAYSIQDGDNIGITVVAEDPEAPASSFTDFQNIRAFVRRLESDTLDVGGGFIWRVGGPVEVNVTYGRTVWGRFTSATNTVSTGVGLRLDVFESAGT